MSELRKANTDYTYFLTLTVAGWIDTCLPVGRSQSAFSNFNSDNGTVQSFNDINTSWVGGLRNRQGGHPYGGLSPVALDASTIASDVEKANKVNFPYPDPKTMRTPIAYRHSSVYYFFKDSNINTVK